MSEPTSAEIDAMSDQQLKEKYDTRRDNTSYGVGLVDYRQELYRRSQDRSTNVMVWCTKLITFMTLVITVATIYGVVHSQVPQVPTPISAIPSRTPPKVSK